MKFRAYRVDRKQGSIRGELCEQELPPLAENQVLVRVHYSGVNYKDALGPTGKGRIQKRFPLTIGIDFAGEVMESRAAEFSKGALVFANGCNFGEERDGGFAEFVVAPKESLMLLPPGLSPRAAMIFGTAGFTAALAKQRMERIGQTPSLGSMVITGASGGAGSFAVTLFSRAGYSVTAVSGRPEHYPWLKTLGAKECLSPEALHLGTAPLERARWGGAVDHAGGKLLAGLSRHINLWGNIAVVGLAESADLQGTVMPLILRGVSLLGISSNNCPMELRQQLWQELGKLAPELQLESFVGLEISLSEQELALAFQRLLQREIRGRILLRLH